MSKGNGLVKLEEASVSAETGFVCSAKLSRIRVFKDQPRRFFDQIALENLARSLKRKQRLPIKVMAITGDPDHDYELIDGERRFRAAKIAELEEIMVWVKQVPDVNEQYVDSVISNFGRADHTPLEKAHALLKLSEMGMLQEEIADHCGYSQGWVSQHLSLLRLQPEVRALMDPARPKEKQLTFSSALRLVSVSPQMQVEIAADIIDRKVPPSDTRFLIQSKTHEAGHGLKQKGRSPSKDHRIISGYALRLERQSELMADMPAPIFTDALASRTRAEVDETVRQIESSIVNLQRLIRNIKAAKPVANAR